MQFSTGIGDIWVQSPSQCLAPYWPPHHTCSYSHSETEFHLCFRTGNISVCDGCRINLTKRENHHTISVCNMKSGECTRHLQRICLSQDLEMLIIMQIQHASWANGLHFTHHYWLSHINYEMNCRLITNHLLLPFLVSTFFHDHHCVHYRYLLCSN